LSGKCKGVGCGIKDLGGAVGQGVPERDLDDPAMKTLPFFSSVAVWYARGVVIEGPWLTVLVCGS
jgi:hypothetical protein